MQTIKTIIKTFFILFILATLIACPKSSGSKIDGSEEGIFSDEDLALQNENRWRDGGTIPTAQANGPFKDLFFAFDSSEVSREYYQELRDNVKIMNEDPKLKVEVEGHCDKRGTTEYNMALGERRAKAVMGLLVSFGANPKQLSTVSYGEEIPLDPTDSESAFAKNRRVHFAVYKK